MENLLVDDDFVVVVVAKFPEVSADFSPPSPSEPEELELLTGDFCSFDLEPLSVVVVVPEINEGSLCAMMSAVKNLVEFKKSEMHLPSAVVWSVTTILRATSGSTATMT